ncbi:MAG: tail-specific protease [Chthoniobacterales bacterium]|nr:tail-specific protease [Chthoniobacterales bacterium]
MHQFPCATRVSGRPVSGFILMRSLLLSILAAGFLSASAPHLSAREDKSAAEIGDITTTVARMLESAHYNRVRLNDETTPGTTQARKALDQYLGTLDYNRLFFTQQDIDEFVGRYGNSLQDDIMLGNVKPAYEIYDRFLQRVQDRVAKIKKLLEKDFTFESDRTVQMNRDEAPWPANEADADKIWADRIEAELLTAVLAEKAANEAAAKKEKEAASSGKTPEKNAEPKPALAKRTPKETVLKRYERLLKSLQEETREDQANNFLAALTQSYDPHSEYMSARTLENFEIQMKLKLFGIGAVLRSEDGYAKIVELVPGGPAAKQGQLKPNDKIVAVAQGDEEFEDVVDMKLDRVVERIRGAKGTTVRLQVQPAASPDPTRLETVSIVRDEVELKEQEAKAQVIDVPDAGGKDTRIGLITLPSFYADMNSNGPSARSTTKDMAALIKRLKRENIEGLIVDLRNDSGGSLPEAIKATGLFIPKGPVVQVKDTNGKITPMHDPDPGILWDGPLIVLMNRLSASASEIFAAALQDYGRAVIVGDSRSFGKGTVQEMLNLDPFMPFLSRGDSGAVKLTRQKFYRIKGGSTQLRGVASDIVLPSLTDYADVGEDSLKHPLDYDEVPSRIFSPAGDTAELVPRLRAASDARAAADPEFAYVREDGARLQERIKKNEITLNKEKRMAEIEEEKARREARNAERKERKKPDISAFEVTLDTVDASELKKVSLDKPPKRSAEQTEENNDPSAPDEEEPFVDPVRDEGFRIMQDHIRLGTEAPVTASARVPESGADTP